MSCLTHNLILFVVRRETPDSEEVGRAIQEPKQGQRSRGPQVLGCWPVEGSNCQIIKGSSPYRGRWVGGPQ